MSISKCDTCHCQKVKKGGVLNPSDDIDDYDDHEVIFANKMIQLYPFVQDVADNQLAYMDF